MPQNTMIQVGSSWTLLTDDNVTAVTFQNKGNYTVEVTATAGTTPPATNAAGIDYPYPMGERSIITLAETFPGISGASRLWARVMQGAAGAVFISHA